MKLVKEGMGPSELFRILVALFLRYLASGEEAVGVGVSECNGLECRMYVTGQAFEVPGTNPFD